ncbi:MAG TPA: hypothetical protein VME18_11800 [Acidobacteriaceae bacterium]|nr:hypothetical protein [Acidobacteriaceae bacterium]
MAVSAIQTLGNWQEAYDAGTSGSTTGQTSVVTLPSLSGAARQFVTTYADEGGERYWVSFGSDLNATNFLYDAWIYLAKSATDIDTLELDINQVVANGQTIIYGFQCDGNSHTWDYTENAGSPTDYVDHWLHSEQSCNVHNWAADTWHHVQIWYSRDDSGNVTYHSVWLDGTEQDIDATVPASFALGWASVLVTNLQVDGEGSSGSSTVYVDKLTVYRW